MILAWERWQKEKAEQGRAGLKVEEKARMGRQASSTALRCTAPKLRMGGRRRRPEASVGMASLVERGGSIVSGIG